MDTYKSPQGDGQTITLLMRLKVVAVAIVISSLLAVITSLLFLDLFVFSGLLIGIILGTSVYFVYPRVNKLWLDATMLFALILTFTISVLSIQTTCALGVRDNICLYPIWRAIVFNNLCFPAIPIVLIWVQLRIKIWWNILFAHKSHI
jgi:hypothetical protein